MGKVPPPKGAKRFQYSPTKMQLAISACRLGMPVRTASARYKVPRITLRNKVKGISPAVSQGYSGYASVLGPEVENELEEWILRCASLGFPITKHQLLDSVKKLVNVLQIKAVPFKSERPGRKWFENFLKRHRKVTQKHAEYVNSARGSVTKENIRKWFDEIQTSLGEDREILAIPQRVFNLDETSFYLAPTGKNNNLKF